MFVWQLLPLLLTTTTTPTMVIITCWSLSHSPKSNFHYHHICCSRASSLHWHSFFSFSCVCPPDHCFPSFLLFHFLFFFIIVTYFTFSISLIQSNITNVFVSIWSHELPHHPLPYFTLPNHIFFIQFSLSLFFFSLNILNNKMLVVHIHPLESVRDTILY